MTRFLISDFGAFPGGKDCAAAIARAVDEAFASGGGTVVVPPGRWYSGTVELKSNVELHIEAGGELVCILDEKFLKGFDDPEAAELLPVSFFIGAAGAQNVSVTGRGIIYGQGELTMIDDHSDGGLDESPLAFTNFRPKLMLFCNCENLLVRDVTLKEAAFWTLHLAGCRHVRVEGISILNNDRATNNDGIEPDSCQDVKIWGCNISTGDDAIVIKAGEKITRRFGPCRDVLISNCTLHSRDSAFKIGTETHGLIENIVVSNCIARDCSRIASILARDGAEIRNVRIVNIYGSARSYASSTRYPMHWWGRGEPVFISAVPRREDAPGPGKIRNISIDGFTADCESSFFISGEPGWEIENVNITNTTLRFVRQGSQPTGFFDEQPSVRDFREHDIPAFYLNRVKGLFGDNISAGFSTPREGQTEKWTGILEAEHSENIEFHRVRGNTARPGLPAAVFNQTVDARLSDWRINNMGELFSARDSVINAGTP
ncbi:MAG: hypothetical protein LBJ24_03920 [Treponema sp.]|jgi:hypothetical protein|nr:hypothetical protein [Treponema sp.]